MKLSVTIATRARPESLNRLIASLAPQLVRDDRELLIADNGTTLPSAIDSAVQIAAHIHETRPGKCRVQNRAAASAKGEILIFLDDDLAVAPGYLDAVANFFDNHPRFAAMKGRILPAEDPVKKVGKLACYLDLPIVDHGSEVIEVRGVLGANMAFRSSALKTVGLFDERLGPGACGHEEETEISARLRQAGFTIGYAPDALVLHDVDPARADRDRFIRIARERGRCRMLHERHSLTSVALRAGVAFVRVTAAHIAAAPPERVATEEKRLAVALGMLDAARGQPAAEAPSN